MQPTPTIWPVLKRLTPADLEVQLAQARSERGPRAVLPTLHALGFGGYAELAFDATEVFLIGAIEITLLALVLVP